MKTYIFTVEHSSQKRGYNRTIRVYRVKNNKPYFVGFDDEIQTASYKGDYAIACKIINEKDGHELKSGGYFLESENIRVLEVA